MTSPLEKYQQHQKQAHFLPDAAQEAAINHLQRLYLDVCQVQQQKQQKRPRLRRKLGGLLGKPSAVQKAPQGLYFWGGVGRGKTYLMDVFYDCLPFENKHRTHFHRFMRHVHERLAVHKGVKNPLLKVAQELAADAQVICFDEFFYCFDINMLIL